MIQILDQKALHQLKQRLNRYERLLQRRHALNWQLEGIIKELDLSDGRTASPPSHRAGAQKREAISRAMKRVWAERRKKRAQAAAATATKSSTPASAAKPARRKSATAVNPARRAAMRRYWAEKRKAASAGPAAGKR